MEKQFADIYSKLANKIVSMIPTKWNKLYYLGEVVIINLVGHQYFILRVQMIMKL
ncbi:immunity protein YezG family protein [Lacrimispora amygdalina]|uniref:immunity protein YezG family protein n=1 Tax=Lacrimispora amygdalina TaxID=253257 RepID=UPI001A9A2E73